MIPWGKSLGMWLVLLVVAVVLGGVRETWLAEHLSELRAHQLETIAVCVIHFVLIVLFAAHVKPTRTQAIGIGVFWTLLLLVFEFAFFHLMLGMPLQEILASFDMRSGRLFSLVVATSLLGPVIATLISKPTS